MLVLAVLLGTLETGRAQSFSDSTRRRLLHLFAPLDLSQVPTGRLAEYGLPLLRLTPFDGTLTDSSLTSPDGFRLVYATAYSAHAAGPNPLPSVQTLNTRLRVAENSNGGAIPLLVQRMRYATVRPDAFDQNLLSYDGSQLHDVPGRAASPYLTHTLFAAAPARAYSTSRQVAFVFVPDLHVQDDNTPVQSLHIDFGDGRGYVAATWNQPVTTTYASAGTKPVKVRVGYGTFASAGTASRAIKPGSGYESHFDVEVSGPAAAAEFYEDPGEDLVFPAVMGAHAGGAPCPSATRPTTPP